MSLSNMVLTQQCLGMNHLFVFRTSETGCLETQYGAHRDSFVTVRPQQTITGLHKP